VSETPNVGISDDSQLWTINSGGVSSTKSTILVSKATNNKVGSNVSVDVILFDAFGNPISNKTVRLSVPGIGNVIGSDAVTNNSGLARLSFTSTLVGVKTVSARDVTDGIDLISTAPVSFISEIFDINISSFTLSITTNTIMTGTTISVYITLKDKYGNPVINVSKDSVIIEVNPYQPTIDILNQPVNATDSDGNTSGSFIAETEEDKVFTVKLKNGDQTLSLTQTYTVKFVKPYIPPQVTTVIAEKVFRENSYAYPNPTRNGFVTFNYSLGNPAEVTIKIYNITGEVIWEQAPVKLPAGDNYKTVWNCVNNTNTTKIAAGVYIYKMIADEKNGTKYVVTKKVIVIQ
jgi:hypothetical protein